MENKEYKTTSYAKFEYTAQEAKKRPEPTEQTEKTASSVEGQFFNLPLKERLKIQTKHLKQKMKATSHDLTEKAKIANEDIQKKSKELHARILKKSKDLNQRIQTKIELHKVSQKQRRQHVGNHNRRNEQQPQPESTKYCHACGYLVGSSGKFCPSCGSSQ